MESKYPDHFICLQQVNKGQWAIVFRRNNLSKQLFDYSAYENTYTYNEHYRDGNCNISFSLTINSSTFYDIFCSDCKYFSATGGNNSFGILMKTKSIKADEIMYQTVNKTISEDTEFVTYQCSVKGFFNSYTLFDKKWSKISKTPINNKSTKMKNKSKPKHRNQTIKEIPYEKVKKTKTIIDINVVKNCLYFKNKICAYFNDMCNPYSIKCKNPDILLNGNKYTVKKTNGHSHKNSKMATHSSEKPQYVKAVVLSHNRKCVYEEHTLKNIKAKIKVLSLNNKVIDVVIPAVHCKECNQYIILKNDFKSIKQKGTLLCHVIDETPEYIAKHKSSSYSGTESKVHRLGYNVIKQGYNYTFTQRKIILANIIENYGITQHEILSMLDTNIARKINLLNYADAVGKWQQDREFVSNYQLGDCPEVIIDEVIVGKRDSRAVKTAAFIVARAVDDPGKTYRCENCGSKF